jgi:hypothetical protein
MRNIWQPSKSSKASCPTTSQVSSDGYQHVVGSNGDNCSCNGNNCRIVRLVCQLEPDGKIIVNALKEISQE